MERSHVFPERTDGEPEVANAGFQKATRHFQKQLLEAALEENDWNIVATAKHLDLSRSHFYNLVNAFGLRRNKDE